jgi:hypothetical protein
MSRRKAVVKASIRCEPRPYTDPHTQDLHQDAAALEAAERKLARLREGLKSLADRCEEDGGAYVYGEPVATELRALLDKEGRA